MQEGVDPDLTFTLDGWGLGCPILARLWSACGRTEL